MTELTVILFLGLFVSIYFGKVQWPVFVFFGLMAGLIISPIFAWNLEKIIIVVLTVKILFIILWLGTKKVRPFQNASIETLGKGPRSASSPGLMISIPFFQDIKLVDMRDIVVDIKKQEVFTHDLILLLVDAVVIYKAKNALNFLYAVEKAQTAIEELVRGLLKKEIGELPLEEALVEREKIIEAIQITVNKIAKAWGIEVTSVELQLIKPVDQRVIDALSAEFIAEKKKWQKL